MTRYMIEDHSTGETIVTADCREAADRITGQFNSGQHRDIQEAIDESVESLQKHDQVPDGLSQSILNITVSNIIVSDLKNDLR